MVVAPWGTGSWELNVAEIKSRQNRDPPALEVHNGDAILDCSACVWTPPAGSDVQLGVGVLLDSLLLLYHWVASITRRVFNQLQLVHELQSYPSLLDLITVVHTLVKSRLEYYNTLYFELPFKMV